MSQLFSLNIVSKLFTIGTITEEFKIKTSYIIVHPFTLFEHFVELKIFLLMIYVDLDSYHFLL